MLFILQDDANFSSSDIELLTLKQELKKQSFMHEYLTESIQFFDEEKTYPSKIDIKEAIPVGSIDFVQKYLQNVHGIKNMNPIEVPNELRLDRFLNRKYAIIDKKELLSKRGYWFTKYASELKYFSHTGLVEQLTYEDDFSKEPFLKEGLYVFSEVKNILSEYRVFVVSDEIKGIQFYDGDPTVMPTPKEISKIKEMVLRYTLNNKRPKAYSLDIAIIETKTEEGRDLMVIECHPFTSLGLYGLVGSFLPYAYRYGLDWYIKYNTPIQKFSNF